MCSTLATLALLTMLNVGRVAGFLETCLRICHSRLKKYCHLILLISFADTNHAKDLFYYFGQSFVSESFHVSIYSLGSLTCNLTQSLLMRSEEMLKNALKKLTLTFVLFWL